MTNDEIKAEARHLFSEGLEDRALEMVWSAIRDGIMDVECFGDFIADVQFITIVRLNEVDRIETDGTDDEAAWKFAAAEPAIEEGRLQRYPDPEHNECEHGCDHKHG